MKHYPEIERSLKELQRLTGLSLSIDLNNETDASGTARKIRALCTAYQEKNDKNIVLRKWLNGEMSQEDFYPFAKRFHINIEEDRAVFLISTRDGIGKSALTILNNIFPHQSNVWLIPISKTQLAAIRTYHQKNPLQIRKTAYEIRDILNTEILLSVYISYSNLTSHLEELPAAYRQACFSMKVGKTFYSDQMIYGYDRLGIGRLLYGLPKETCEAYIQENLGDHNIEDISHIFEGDSLHTVNCFLRNNLNIAETARQLHMHRNTLLYRLEQIQNDTGLDIRSFEQAMTFKIASMLVHSLA